MRNARSYEGRCKNRVDQSRGGGGTFVGCLVVAALMLSPHVVRAQGCPNAPPGTTSTIDFPTTCEFLPRSPILLQPYLAAQCEMDQDGNGLDDEIEAQIAHCFVPEFRFDSKEQTEPFDFNGIQLPPSLEPCEPIVGFSAYRIATPQDDDILIRFRFVAMFRRDGGFVADQTWPTCLDDHPGDTQQFNFDVRVKKNGVWRASLHRFDVCGSPVFSGARPVLFPSAGKHHLKCAPGTSSSTVECGADILCGPLPCECSCHDPHRGDGVVRVPQHLFRIGPSKVAFDGDHAGNVCRYAGSLGTQLVVAPRLQQNDLANLGFPGQTLDDDFYDADSVWSVLKPDGAFTWDADGDGLSEVSFVKENGVVLTRPADLCGLDRVVTSSDPDADQLRGKCDPDPSFRQKYVGIGEPGFPPVPLPQPSWGNPVHAYGGFWDQDQDYAANGFDGCPTLVTSSQGISNRWAEDVNWPPGGGNHDFGFFQRGDSCDPYPVSLTKWKKTFQRSTKCGPPRFVTSGSDYVLTRTAAARGASANDAYWDTKQADAPKTWLGNGYRCACRDALTGAPISGPACVLNQASECFRNDVTEANRQLYNGRGWRALDRAGCARSGTWCDPVPLPVPRFDLGQSSSHWAWTQETAAFPTGSATQHFSPGDLLSVPGSLINGAHVRAQREYAVWSLVELQQHLGLPKRPSAPFIDPEFHPLGEELRNDVNSPQGTRIRSSVSEKTLSGLTSAHQSLTVGITCGLLTLEQQLGKVKLWFGPDPVLPERYDVSQLRALVHGDGPLLSAAVLRPTEGNYATLSLGDVAMDSWLSSSSVGITALATDRLVSGPLPGLAAFTASERDPVAEPDLFVFERGVSDRPARFARLAPVSITITSARYEAVRFGELRGTVSSAAEVVTDAEGRVAAVVDFHNGVVEAVLPDGELPMRHALPAALSGRSTAALALRGNLLLVAGGLSDAGVHSDLWLLDLYSGTSRELRTDLPARRGALLSVTPNGSHVLYAGGFDAMSNQHDDVWRLASPAAPPGEAKPALLYADTAAANTGLSASALALDAIGGELLRVTYQPTAAEGLALATRTESGWEPLDDTGDVQRCAVEDADGGRLCSLSPAWWASTGRTACESTSCGGSAGELLGTAKLKPAIVAADVSTAGAWLARPHRVDFVETSGEALGATHGAFVHGKPLDIAAQGATALFTTRDGVRLAILESTGLALGEELALCGTPFDVEPLAEDTWAAITTLGLAIVGGGVTTPLRVLSMSLLVPAGPQGTLLPLSTDANTEWACKLAKPFAHAAGALRAITALAPVARGRVLVSHGKHVFDVDTSTATEPVLRDVLHLNLPLFALRADDRGGRAYGLGPGPKHRPVIDLRGPQLLLAQQHDIADWVRRRDAGAMRLARHGAWAELAWVAP